MATKNNVIYFTPYVWAWIEFLKRECKTEVFAFGVAEKEVPSLIVDLYIPKQTAGTAFAEIEEEDTLKMIEEMVDLGYETGEFMRYFIHTHPGESPQPSGTDERTYKTIFGKMDWSSMIIFAKGGPTFCRTQFQTGPGADVSGDLRVYFSGLFPGVDQEVIDRWDALAKQQVTERVYTPPVHQGNGRGYSNEFGHWESNVWVRTGDNAHLALRDSFPSDFDFDNDDEYWVTHLEWIDKEEKELRKRRSISNGGRKSEYSFAMHDLTQREKQKIDKAKEELRTPATPEPILPEKKMNLKYPNVETYCCILIPEGTAQDQFNAAYVRLDTRYEEGVRREFLRVLTAILKERRADLKARAKAAPAASEETTKIPVVVV